MNQVTTTEAMHVRVAMWLKQKGIQTKPAHGLTFEYNDFFSVFTTFREPRRFLGMPFCSVDNEYRIAYLYLRDERVGAKGKSWVIEIFGRQYMDQLTDMAKQLAKEFEVKIHLRLEAENPKRVVYRSEF